jgi:hypothetical protein
MPGQHSRAPRLTGEVGSPMPRQYTPRIEVICAYCQQPFSRPPSVIAKGQGKYCSRACSFAEKRAVEHHCETCHKAFLVEPNQMKRGGGRFCSRACRKLAPLTLVTCTCEQCGTEFKAARSRVVRGNGRFCSLSCLATHNNRQRAKPDTVNAQGYVVVQNPTYPGDGRTKQILEHRLVMERHLGRPLTRDELVHHLGEKTDNRIEMLQLVTPTEHRALHATGRWAREYDQCVRCGTTDRYHAGHGLCWRCHSRERYHHTHPNAKRLIQL